MSNKKSSSLVSTLRFPEFREAGEWVEKEVRTFFDLNRENIKAVKFDKQNIITVKLHCAGVIKNERNANLTGGTNYSVRKAGQFIFSKIDFLNGAFGIIPSELDGFLSSSDIPAFSFNNKIVPLFFQYWLSENYKKLKIERTGTSNTLKRISTNSFFSIVLAVPTFSEQQKIAACLSSLDELITVHSQKLDALKKHKKGLMQQLFPAEGETVPTLRFPEFRDAGEWEEKSLGKLLLSHPDYGVNAPAVPYSNQLPTYIRITDISDEGYFYYKNKVSVAINVKDENYLAEGDIVLARTGATVGKSYKYRQEDGKLVFAGFLIRIRPNSEKIDSTFLFNFLSTQRYWNWVKVTSTRSGQPGINGNEYASLSISLPPYEEEGLLEQQKIAACLSSLDELITAQGQKLDALKKHKKGLMQQLFPVVEE